MSDNGKTYSFPDTGRFFEDLTDDWTEVLVLPSAVPFPPGTRLYRKRVEGGGLSCLIAAVGVGRVQLQVSFVAQPGATEGRPPTVAELAEAIQRFAGAGECFALMLRAGPPAPWPIVTTLVLLPIAITAEPVGVAAGRGR